MMKSNPKPGKHLPFHHPQQEHLRNWIKLQLGRGVFHPLLVCNFDQVWCTLYSPKSTTLQVQDHVKQKSRSLRALRHCLERALQFDHTESFDDPPVGTLKPKIQGGSAASACVDQWRTPRTLTTLSWRCGRVGRGFITCREDSLTAEQRNQANEELGFQIDSFSRLFPFYFFSRGSGISGEVGKRLRMWLGARQMDLYRSPADQVPHMERRYDAGIPAISHGRVAVPSS